MRRPITRVKASAIACKQHYEKAFNPQQNTQASYAESNEEPPISYKLTEDEADQLNKPFTKEELKQAIDKQKADTAPGYYGIPNSLLKELTKDDSMHETILYLMNQF